MVPMRIKFTLFPTLILCLMFGIGWKPEYHNHLEYQESQSGYVLNQPSEIIPKEIVQDMIGQVNQERILTDLRRLTGVEPVCTSEGCYTITGRETGSEGLQWAKDYVFETLDSLHFRVEVQNWSMQGYTDQNIIARKDGFLYPDEEIYFIAHLDGYLDNNPAADDDASGVVALLELARILVSHSLSHPVVFLISTGEEHGTLGARSYVAQLTQEEIDSIQYVVSAEMLGWDSDNDGAMQLWSGDPLLYPSSYIFTQMLGDIITAYPLNLIPQIVTGCD